MFGAAKKDKPFKDYCLTLQVHPEADAAMVDAAYWHLAKRYNEAAPYDPKARAKLEELNEAYTVLGSAERREEYMKLRVQALGEGALPQAPRPERTPPPLSVMNRQRPHEREEAALVASLGGRLTAPRLALGALMLCGLGAAALAATTSLVVAAVAAGGVLAVAVAVGAILAALPRLRAMRLGAIPHPKVVTLKTASAAHPRFLGRGRKITLKAQAEQLRRIAAKAEPASVDTKSDPPAKA